MTLRYILITALLLAPHAAAEEVVFYRCTDAAGALTMQNMPCPKGSKQETKVMQGVGSLPARPAPPPAARPTHSVATPAPALASSPTPTPSPTAPTPSPPESTEASTSTADGEPVERLPPPVLFQCTTYDKDSYITESAEPQSRCVALRTVGLDGNPQTGAGEACEVVKDLCAQVPDGALCEAWKKRRDQTEVAWRFARPENAEKNRIEFERAQQIYRESNCGG